MLCFVSVSAFSADWRLVTSSTQGDAIFVEMVFVDAKSIKTEASLVSALVLGEYGRFLPLGESGRSFRSFTAAFLFDCRKRKAGVTQITSFSESMAGGEVVNRNFLKFEPVVVRSGSMDEALLNFACSSR